MPVAKLECLQRLYRPHSLSMLHFKRKLLGLLDTLSLLFTQQTSLPLVLRGRFLLSCSSQSQAMLRFNSKLFGLLDAFSLFTQQTSLPLVLRALSSSCASCCPRHLILM
jgi:hypothetical protein